MINLSEERQRILTVLEDARDEKDWEMVNDTIADLEAGGRTPEQVLIHRAKAVGINPAGMTSADLEKKVSALEALDSEE